MKLYLSRFLSLCILFSSFGIRHSSFADTPIKNLKISGTSEIQAGTFVVKSGAMVTFESGSSLDVSATVLTLANGQVPWAKVAKTVQDFAFPTSVLSALNVDWSASQSYVKTLAANSTFTFSNTKDGQAIRVALTNTAGNYTVTWPAAVRWPANTAPTQTTGAKTDVYTFVRLGFDLYGSVYQDYNPPTATPTPTPGVTPTPTPTPTPSPTPSPSPTPPASPQTFTYVSDGDANGIFYFIGRNLGTAAWTNPDTAAYLVSVRSSDNGGTANDLVNRAAENTYSLNAANSWIAVDLGAGRSAVVSDYSLRLRNVVDTRAMRNWKLQGTNTSASNSVADLDAATWTDIDTRVGDTTMAASSGSWGFYTVPGSPSGYRYLRILQNGVNGLGDNYLTLCEWELYGVLSY